MKKVTLHDKTFREYIPNAELEKIIDGVAEKVNADFAGTTEIPVFLCVLNGAMMFTAAMMKRVNFKAELVSVKLTSYTGTQSNGTILIPMGLTGPVKGRTVIIFEDIVDTGNTLVALKELLMSNGATDVRFCTMLYKPGSYHQTEKIDYYGKAIPNDFIVGYGLDYDELGRNLPDIYILDE